MHHFLLSDLSGIEENMNIAAVEKSEREVLKDAGVMFSSDEEDFQGDSEIGFILFAVIFNHLYRVFPNVSHVLVMIDEMSVYAQPTYLLLVR